MNKNKEKNSEAIEKLRESVQDLKKIIETQQEQMNKLVTDQSVNIRSILKKNQQARFIKINTWYYINAHDIHKIEILPHNLRLTIVFNDDRPDLDMSISVYDKEYLTQQLTEMF